VRLRKVAPRTLSGVSASDVRVVAPGLGAVVHDSPETEAADPPQGHSVARTGLQVSGLRVEYSGGIRALDDVSLTVGVGEAVAVVGVNGAGKSTLARTIAGLSGFVGARVVRGEVRYQGRVITNASPWAIARAGVQLLPERKQVFQTLSVKEHIRLADKSETAVDSLLPELRELIVRNYNKRAGDLSGGQRQLLALICGILRSPSLLVVDECSLGLAPSAIEAVIRALAWARESYGLSLLVVEQNTSVARDLSTRAAILDGGSVVWSGRSDELTHELAVDSYVGRRK
jgi:branched-chain amino acid transport system ATP-binding protein